MALTLGMGCTGINQCELGVVRPLLPLECEINNEKNYFVHFITVLGLILKVPPSHLRQPAHQQLMEIQVVLLIR